MNTFLGQAKRHQLEEYLRTKFVQTIITKAELDSRLRKIEANKELFGDDFNLLNKDCF